MNIEADFSAIKTVKPKEYAVRFFFGGLVTVMAGLIAKYWGPGIGGLFLAFPAIFPASATLIETHEKLKKQRAGFDGARRGREAAAIDAAGASIGTIGLIAFALVVWLYLPAHAAWSVLSVAGLAWFLVAFVLWALRKRL